MGIDWMTRDELAESIPPYFTEHLGGFLMDRLRRSCRMNAPHEHGHRERKVLTLARRLDAALRLLTFGPDGFGIQPHEPIAKVSGGCLVLPPAPGPPQARAAGEGTD